MDALDSPPRPLQVHVYEQEGSVMFDEGQGKGPQPVVSAITLVAIPSPAPGKYDMRYVLHGMSLPTAEAIATFLYNNPPMWKIVSGLLEMAASGRLDGRMPPQGPATTP